MYIHHLYVAKVSILNIVATITLGTHLIVLELASPLHHFYWFGWLFLVVEFNYMVQQKKMVSECMEYYYKAKHKRKGGRPKEKNTFRVERSSEERNKLRENFFPCYYCGNQKLTGGGPF